MYTANKIGRYEIRAKLGAGGMGEVYLAHDTQLNRAIALKILPKDFSSDDILRHRFKQEARAASALNHPNIITIFEVGESDDGLFIATEYIEGETLRQNLKHSPLRIMQAVRFAEQIAQALVAAHEAGIIHRDIKPENIMIRRDGYVKVLDFGLAKPTDTPENFDDSTAQIVNTIPGMVMGSVRYMSPEQARGIAVDGRSDIWSLGAVLFEMLTGTPPFNGPTTGDTLAAVLHLEPAPLARLAPNAPAELQRILRKALQKERDERYQSSRDFALDLKNLLYEIEHEISLDNHALASSKPDITENPTMIHHTSGAALNTSGANHQTRGSVVHTSSAEYLVNQVKSNKQRIASVVVGLIAICAAAFFGYRWWLNANTNQAATAFVKTQVSRIGTDGKVFLPAISPDGKYVAYIKGEAGNQSLIVRQLSTDSEVTVVQPNSRGFAGIVFAPAGDRIFYTQISSDGRFNTLYQIPTLGGTSKQVIEDVDSPVTFSPDAKRLAFMRKVSTDGSSIIFTADTDGANLQPLISTKQTPFSFFASPAWSPDGAKILVGAGKNQGGFVAEAFIVEINVTDGKHKVFGHRKWNSVGTIRWLKDGSGFLAVGRESETAASQIWRVSYSSAEAEPVTNDFNDYSTLSLSSDAAAFVTARGEITHSLWTYSLEAKELTQNIPETRNLFWDTRLAETPDNKLFFSRRAGKDVNIWAIDADGKNERQIVPDAHATSAPVVTPDGRFIVFASRRSSGNSRLWRTDADGVNLVQLTEDNADQGDFHPKITPDGKTIIFNRTIVNNSVLMKVPVEGGSAEEVFNDPNATVFLPVPSPDGKRLAYYFNDNADLKRKIHIALLENNKVKQIERVLNSDFITTFTWSPDSKSLMCLRSDGVTSIWKLPLDEGGKPEIFADFKTGRIFNFKWSLDGKSVYIVRGTVNNDLILIKNVTGSS